MMENETVDFAAVMRLACEEIVNERVAYFDGLDVTGITISKKTERKFKRMLRWELLKSSGWYKAVQKTAIACVVVFAVLLGTVLAVEPVRAYVWEIATKWYTDCVEIIFKKDELVSSKQKVLEIKLPIIPDGWTISKLNEDAMCLDYEIQTTDGERIFYSQFPLDTQNWIDNSEHTIEEITLKDGEKAYLFEYEEGYTILTWQSDCLYWFESRNVSEDILIELANTIK